VSLQRETRTPVLNFARNYAVYQRTKPHVNIGMQLRLPLPFNC
jgi:elongation factor Tu